MTHPNDLTADLNEYISDIELITVGQQKKRSNGCLYCARQFDADFGIGQVLGGSVLIERWRLRGEIILNCNKAVFSLKICFKCSRNVPFRKRVNRLEADNQEQKRLNEEQNFPRTRLLLRKSKKIARASQLSLLTPSEPAETHLNRSESSTTALLILNSLLLSWKAP